MRTQHPLVSVIIPSYNHAKFITETVESVLNQTLTEIEIIVVDDGSTDGTAELVAQMSDHRLHFISLKQNRRFNPRNIALASAQGQYIAFQNSDDTWEQTKLEKQIAVLEQQPEVSVCFTGVKIIDEDHQPLSETWANNLFQKENRSSDAWLRYFFDRGNAFCIASACARQSLFKKVGYFNPNLIQLADFDLWVRLAALGEFQVLPEALTHMRIVKDRNVSAPSPTTSRRSTFEFVEVLQRFTQQPVLSRLCTVFADVLPGNSQTVVTQLAGLAQHAWTLQAPHVVFGNNLMANLMSNHHQRQELLNFFGTAVFYEFIKKRGQVDVVLNPDS